MKVKIAVVILCCVIYLVIGDQFYTIDGRQYYFSYPYKLSWIRALRHCTYNGMYLLDVRNSFENDRVLALMDKVNVHYQVNYTDYWTSGTDQGKEGDFYWATTGHPIMYGYWINGEPSGGPIENCIHYVDVQNRVSLGWNDVPCDIEKCFICRDYFDIPVMKSSDCANWGST